MSLGTILYFKFEKICSLEGKANFYKESGSWCWFHWDHSQNFMVAFFGKIFVNPFQVGIPLLRSLKTLENLDVLRVHGKGMLAWHGVIHIVYII